MAQAKGILPRRDDRDVLYKNPRTSGFFIGVKLDPGIDRPRAETWLGTVSTLVDELVARIPADEGDAKGEKVAAVAVGLAPRFFALNGEPRFNPSVEPPIAFRTDTTLPNASGPLSAVPVADVDVMFYVASVFEARVNAFVSRLAELRPDVQAITLDRGYQRLDETEPFGYRDGVRNIATVDRSKFVFVHRDGAELDEPAWADGGSYMAYLKILQHPEQFASLPDDATRDMVIGRTKDGTRLDLVGQSVHPHKEPAEPPPNLAPTSHVLKAGPRGPRDDVQLFRRGLPFIETTSDGQLRVGLNFCSFQASLEQFDVVMNDWMLSRQFPPQPDGADPGADALLDPARQFTTMEKQGYFFVPPYDEDGLAAAVFKKPPKPDKRPRGRLVVRKRVIDPSDPSRRFERRGFKFQVLDAQRQIVPGSEFTTDSIGRGVCPAVLEVGQAYTVQETFSPVANVQLTETPLTMEKPRQQLRILNQVTQPNTPYGQ